LAHLDALGQRPRPAGSPAAASAQEYCATQLRAAGFAIAKRPFSFSALPGRFGAPILGALGWILAAETARTDDYRIAILMTQLGILAATTFLASRWASRLPLLTERGENLEAVRGNNPRIWLVAHIDSKSQPVSTAVRTLGASLLAAAMFIAPFQLLVDQYVRGRSLAPIVVVCASLGGLILVASIVQSASDGAVDNASGVAAVLEAATLVDPEVPLGVLITDAEELALGGARDWVRGREPGIAINCDTIDDEGPFRIMDYGMVFGATVPALAVAQAGGVDVKLTSPLRGILTDSAAFKAANWATVTLSRGTLRTLNRIHTRRDGLQSMRGTGITAAARILAGIVEELA
jgi:peptidase M28-like protein